MFCSCVTSPAANVSVMAYLVWPVTVAVPPEYPTEIPVPPATITIPLLDAVLSSAVIVTLPVAPLTSIPSPATAVAT